MAFFNLPRFVFVKYSRAFVERLLCITSSLVSRLTTVNLDIFLYEAKKLSVFPSVCLSALRDNLNGFFMDCLWTWFMQS